MGLMGAHLQNRDWAALIRPIMVTIVLNTEIGELVELGSRGEVSL